MSARRPSLNPGDYAKTIPMRNESRVRFVVASESDLESPVAGTSISGWWEAEMVCVVIRSDSNMSLVRRPTGGCGWVYNITLKKCDPPKPAPTLWERLS